MQDYRFQNQEKFGQVVNLKKTQKKEKINPYLKIPIYFIIFFFIILLIFKASILVTSDAEETDTQNWFQKMWSNENERLTSAPDKKIISKTKDRINIVLLGMGGKRHEGAYLTDTIILASLKPSTKEVAMISLPRDMHLPVANLGWRKINNINAFAEAREKGSGGGAVCETLTNVFDLEIDYYVRVDFQGFINIIDKLGGIEIDVEHVINDVSYPIMGNEEVEPYEDRFEHLYIPKGVQTMDGSLALKYARSRHSTGIEGSDFARARRQQRIIQAARDKALSKYTLLNPKLVTEILSELKNHISTNIPILEGISIAKQFKDTSRDNISTHVLDDGPHGLLLGTRNTRGEYVLAPRSGNFNEIKYFIKNIFQSSQEKEKEKIKAEDPSVQIINGTYINNLAQKTSADLEKYGFDITRINDSTNKDHGKSIVYDLSFGKKKNSLTFLEEKCGAELAINLPDWLRTEIQIDLKNNPSPKQPDFILFLGNGNEEDESEEN